MNIPARIISEYLSPEDEKMDPQEVYKSLECIQMMVSIRNTDRLVNAIEKLNKTISKSNRRAKAS